MAIEKNQKTIYGNTQITLTFFSAKRKFEPNLCTITLASDGTPTFTSQAHTFSFASGEGMPQNQLTVGCQIDVAANTINLQQSTTDPTQNWDFGTMEFREPTTQPND